MLIIKSLFLILVLIGIGFLIAGPVEKYLISGMRKHDKFGFRGTSRQYAISRIEEDLEKITAKWIPMQLINWVKQSGIKSLGEFILYVLVSVVMALIGDAVILTFFRQVWWIIVPVTFLACLPFVHLMSKIQENKRALIIQAPIFTSVIAREFSRYGTMKYAFIRAQEETSGWVRSCFQEMNEYLVAVTDDIDGALEIFKQRNHHIIINQFVMGIRQGLATNKVHDALQSISQNAIYEKKMMELAEAKKNDGAIFFFIFILVIIFMGQITFVLFGSSGSMINNLIS